MVWFEQSDLTALICRRSSSHYPIMALILFATFILIEVRFITNWGLVRDIFVLVHFYR